MPYAQGPALMVPTDKTQRNRENIFDLMQIFQPTRKSYIHPYFAPPGGEPGRGAQCPSPRGKLQGRASPRESRGCPGPGRRGESASSRRQKWQGKMHSPCDSLRLFLRQTLRHGPLMGKMVSSIRTRHLFYACHTLTYVLKRSKRQEGLVR